MTDQDPGEDYVRIPCRIVRVREAAVLIAVGDSVPRATWIPRSCIHGADDRTLRTNANRTLRIFRWKAEQEGLEPATDPAGASGDLFGPAP